MISCRLGILVIILLFAPVSASAGPLTWLDDWDVADRLLLSGYSATWFIDWGQTRMIADNPDRWYETNRWLGEHPDKSTVNVFFLVSYGGNLFIADTLGDVPKWLGIDWGFILRKGWLLYLANMHYRYIDNNKDVGLSISFDLAKF